MKIGLLLLFVLGSAIAQANGWYPYAPEIFTKQTQFNSLTDNPVVFNRYRTTYQQAHQQSQYYYSGQSMGSYPYRPAHYPLFYYLPEIRNAGLQAMKVPEFQDVNDILDKKSEQAMLRNNQLLGHQKHGHQKPGNLNHEILSGVQEELGNESSLSGMELSELTASSLILSARKKQMVQKIIPNNLLDNHRFFHMDREKLNNMFNDLETGSTISTDDE